MKNRTLLLLFLCFSISANSIFPWGFFAHKRINKYAVFTLSEELIGFYKKKEEITDSELKKFINDNKDQLKVEYIDFSYAIINPKNLIGVDDFNQSFFDKIDQIEIDISNEVQFETIVSNFNITPINITNFKISSDKNKIEQKIFELRNNNLKHEEVLFFKNTTYKLLIFSFPVFLISFFIIEDIFIIVFGSEWMIAATYSMVLIPMLYFRFTGSIISSVVLVYGKQKKALYLEVLNTILRFLSLLIGGLYNDILLGLVLFSATSSFVSIYRLKWYFQIVK